MSEKRLTYVEVWNSESPDTDGIESLPESAVEFAAWLTAVIAEVPSEFQKDVMIDFEVAPDYDGGHVGLELYYQRPETEEEEKERLRKDQERAKADEEWERKMLRILKEKYEKPA